MTTIYLMRHGALSEECSGCFIGQVDLPLAPLGFHQAKTLAHALRDKDLDAIYCSDLLRARQTAAHIADGCGLPITERAALREIALGQWEGLPRDEVARRFPDQFAARGRDIAHYRVPEGESFFDCQQRVLRAWDEIRNSGAARIAIVAHAGTNRLLLCHLLGMPIARMYCLGQDYGCVSLIDEQGDCTRVVFMNARAATLRTWSDTRV